jgi:hypothetical protein
MNRAGIVILIFLMSCNSINNELKHYYNSDRELHHQIADSLMEFSREHHTTVVLRKRLDREGQVEFRYSVQADEPMLVPIFFDASLKRTDPFPRITSQTMISPGFLHAVKKIWCNSIYADSNEVFFGYTYHFNGNSQNGIVIEKDHSGKKHSEKIGEGVYITDGIIP